MAIIAVANSKGGCGKSTVAVSLAAVLPATLVDADPQGNVGISLGIRNPHHLGAVVMERATLADAAVPIRENLEVLCADYTLAEFEIHLGQRPHGRGALVGLEEAVEDVEAVLLVTRWPQFQALPTLLNGSAPQPLVIDGRRVLDPDRFDRYEGIGRGPG